MSPLYGACTPGAPTRGNDPFIVLEGISGRGLRPGRPRHDHSPGRLERLRSNFDRAAADDPTAVIIDTDDRTPGELADTVTDHLTDLST